MPYKAGDRVRIRSWRSMENEFGTDHDGDICMSDNYGIFDWFLKSEKHICGQVVTILRLSGNCVIDTGANYFSVEAIDKTYYHGGDDVGI